MPTNRLFRFTSAYPYSYFYDKSVIYLSIGELFRYFIVGIIKLSKQIYNCIRFLYRHPVTLNHFFNCLRKSFMNFSCFSTGLFAIVLKFPWLLGKLYFNKALRVFEKSHSFCKTHWIVWFLKLFDFLIADCNKVNK